MSFLRIDASIRREGSVSRALADRVEAGWLAARPGDEIASRDLADQLAGPREWALAATAGAVPEDQRSPETVAAVATATEIADEVLAADGLVVASPLYNFGLPATLKIWIDLLVTDPRFAPGTQPLAGVPVTLALARGGGYGAGTPREGWDHATPYLQRILGDVFGADVSEVAAELTLAEVVPALADLRPLARQSLTDALALAEATGRAHAERLDIASASRGTDRVAS
jgi:FMN-dependent NADH-azoreductase